MLLTTQYLEEADQLAARIAVIDHGRVIAEETPGQLKAAAGSGTLRIRLSDPAQRPMARQALAGLLSAPVQDGPEPALLTARVGTGPAARPASDQAAAAVTALGQAGIAIGEFALGQPSLDEVFLALTSPVAGGSPPAPRILASTPAESPATGKEPE